MTSLTLECVQISERIFWSKFLLLMCQNGIMSVNEGFVGWYEFCWVVWFLSGGMVFSGGMDFLGLYGFSWVGDRRSRIQIHSSGH